MRRELDKIIIEEFKLRRKIDETNPKIKEERKKGSSEKTLV